MFMAKTQNGKFQSTRPRGRTRHLTIRNDQQDPVSIHASSREDATSHDIINIGLILVSIHASSREDATESCAYVARYIMFQSTRPRGRTRRTAVATNVPQKGFQSTRPRGRTRL